MSIDDRIKDRDIEVYINSSVDKRDTDTTSDFTVLFPQNIPLRGQAYTLSVQSASVPNTMPQFNTDQRKFAFQFDGDASPTEVELDKRRVFNATSEFVTYLQTTLNSTGGSVVVELDTETRTIKITNNGPNDLSLITTSYMPFWQKIGFEKIQETTNGSILVPSGGGVVLANTLCVLIATQRVYITCNEIVNNSFIGSTTTNPPVLLVMDIEGSFGTISTYESNNPAFFNHDCTLHNNLNFLSFTLLDDRYQPIELLGSGVKLSLVIAEK